MAAISHGRIEKRCSGASVSGGAAGKFAGAAESEGIRGAGIGADCAGATDDGASAGACFGAVAAGIAFLAGVCRSEVGLSARRCTGAGDDFVCVRDAGCVVAAGCCWLGRLTMPGRLKFRSSRGPIASVGGVFACFGAVAGGDTSPDSGTFYCASPGAGRSTIQPVSNNVSKRNFAFIAPARSPGFAVPLSRAAQPGNARRAERIQADAL